MAAHPLSLDELRSLLETTPHAANGEEPKKLFACAFCHQRFAKFAVRCSRCRTIGTVSLDYRGAEDHVPLVARESAISEEEESLQEGPENDERPQVIADITDEEIPPISSGLRGFDHTTGGGFAGGKLFLVSGRPGVGKSTLLLQALSIPADKGKRVFWGTSEETKSQVAKRAKRVKASLHIEVWSETDIDKVLGYARGMDIIVLDSLQMFIDNHLNKAPGSISQVKNCGIKSLEFARETGAAVVLLAQVDKTGKIAGPNHVAHICDGVFQLKRVKGGRRQFVCEEKNRTGQAPAIWRCRMDEDGKLVER
jgi:DNA repair protein RadA/Sms